MSFLALLGQAGASLANSLGSFGLNQLSSAQSYSRQKKLLRMQQDFARETMQNRHQWEIGDLRAAGLNPILSALSGGPIASGGSAPAVQSTAAVDLASGFEKTGKTMQGDKLADSQIALNASMAGKQEADTQTAQQTARTLKSQEDSNILNAKNIEIKNAADALDFDLKRQAVEAILKDPNKFTQYINKMLGNTNAVSGTGQSVLNWIDQGRKWLNMDKTIQKDINQFGKDHVNRWKNSGRKNNSGGNVTNNYYYYNKSERDSRPVFGRENPGDDDFFYHHRY